MAKLIGHITYPKESELSVEYTKLYSENDACLLEFRLVNHGTKTVNAYRAEISYRQDGANKTETVQGKNLELVGGSATDIITVTLPKSAEEGSITLSAVIYEDLSHNETTPEFPFASFDTVSRVAETVLSGATPMASSKETAKDTLLNIAKGQSTSPSPAVERAKEQLNVKKSHLPFILALSALGGIILTFVLRLFAFHYIADNFGTTNPGEVFSIVSIVCIALFAGCAALALTAILIRKKNPGQSVAVWILNILTILIYLFFITGYGFIFLIAPIILASVFLVLALVKKDLALLLAVISMILVVFLLIGLFGGCGYGCTNEKTENSDSGNIATGTVTNTTAPSSNNTPIYDEYIVLQYEHYDPGEVTISGYYWTSGTFTEDDITLDHIPVINGVIDLVIPESTHGGDIIAAIGENAFRYDERIVSLTLSSGVREIFSYAFENCINLKTADLSNLQRIGEAAFQNCRTLESVTGLDSVYAIHNNAFHSCEALQSFSFGSHLELIGDTAFSYSGLTSVTIPARVSHLGTGIFFECNSLIDAEMDANFYQLPTETFAGCEALERVRLSSSIEEIHNRAFADCYSLSRIIFEGSEESWHSIPIGEENDTIQNAILECLNEGRPAPEQ